MVVVNGIERPAVQPRAFGNRFPAARHQFILLSITFMAIFGLWNSSPPLSLRLNLTGCAGDQQR